MRLYNAILKLIIKEKEIMQRTYDDRMFIDTFEHQFTWLNGFMRLDISPICVPTR